MLTLSIKTVSSLEKCFWDDDLASIPEKKEFVMLKNERLSFQVVYRAQDDSRNISRATPISLSGELAPYTTVRLVGNVLNMYPTYNVPFEGELIRTDPGAYPDLLRPLTYPNAISLPNGQTLSLFVDIELPEDFPAGEYPFALTVTKKGEVLGEATATVRVIDALLPPQTLIHTEWFYTDCIANYYHTKAFSEAHWRAIESYMRTAVKNGINMILTPVFTPELDTRVGGERLTTQLVDIELLEDHSYRFTFDKLHRFIDLALSSGVRYFEIPHFFTQWGAKATPKIVVKVKGRKRKYFGWHTDALSEEYRRFLAAFIPALVGEFKKRGLDHNCYYHVSDEPGHTMLSHYAACKERIAPYLEGYPIIDAMSNLDFYKEGVLEKPVPNTRSAMTFIEAGVKDLWVYYCGGGNAGVSDRSLSMPLARTRILGVQLYLYRIAGFLHWGYNFYNTWLSYGELDPYASPEGGYFNPAGDCFLVYPGTDGKAWESLRLNALREAMDDIRALTLYEERFGREATERLILEGTDGRLDFTHYPTDPAYLITLREKIAAALSDS